jgi:hypothetical protein
VASLRRQRSARATGNTPRSAEEKVPAQFGRWLGPSLERSAATTHGVSDHVLPSDKPMGTEPQKSMRTATSVDHSVTDVRARRTNSDVASSKTPAVSDECGRGFSLPPWSFAG